MNGPCCDCEHYKGSLCDGFCKLYQATILQPLVRWACRDFKLRADVA